MWSQMCSQNETGQHSKLEDPYLGFNHLGSPGPQAQAEVYARQQRRPVRVHWRGGRCHERGARAAAHARQRRRRVRARVLHRKLVHLVHQIPQPAEKQYFLARPGLVTVKGLPVACASSSACFTGNWSTSCTRSRRLQGMMHVWRTFVKSAMTYVSP